MTTIKIAKQRQLELVDVNCYVILLDNIELTHNIY